MIDIDFSTKRAKLALRFFTYGVMTLATIVLTIIVVLLALGYRLESNFNFSQGGLVQFRSSPNGAVVTIDGKKQSFRTPNKANLTAGIHTVGMSLAGYKDWNKTIELAPGELLWLNYTHFIPKTITTTTVREFDTITNALASPDHHWLLLQTSTEVPAFTLVDFSNEKKPEYTSIQLPDTLLTKKDNKIGTLSFVEWDLSSRYVLIKHQNGDTSEFIRFDRSKPNESINLTRMFSLNITDAHFSASNPNTLFAKTDDVLRRLDLAGTSASAALISGLKQFVVYGEDSIAFVSEQEKTTDSPATKQQIVGVYRHGKTTTLRALPLNQQAVIAYSEYYNHSYLAIGTTDSSTVDLLRDPSAGSGAKDNEVFAHLDLGAPVGSLSFSNNGRILLAQRDSAIASYDLETSRGYSAHLASSSPLHWLDDFHLWSEVNGQLTLAEFDGENRAAIAAFTPTLTVMPSNDGTLLFSFSRNTTGKFLLQASKLTVE